MRYLLNHIQPKDVKNFSSLEEFVSKAMKDTPHHIKELQLKIWLSKSPGERLKQFLEDNDALFKFWEKAKELNKSIIKENRTDKQ